MIAPPACARLKGRSPRGVQIIPVLQSYFDIDQILCAMHKTVAAPYWRAWNQRRQPLPPVGRQALRRSEITVGYEPSSTGRGCASKQDIGECAHKHGQKRDESVEEFLPRLQEFLAGPVQQIDHPGRDQNQEHDFQDRQLIESIPWNGAYLRNGPLPDHAYKAENCGEPLLQELKQLIEKLHIEALLSLPRESLRE
jgi:hypothetical protein